jgi:hypothetical protein
MSSLVVALCLLLAEKLIVKRNCLFLNEIASEKKVKVVADGVYTAKSSKQNQVERESD